MTIRVMSGLALVGAIAGCTVQVNLPAVPSAAPSASPSPMASPAPTPLATRTPASPTPGAMPSATPTPAWIGSASPEPTSYPGYLGEKTDIISGTVYDENARPVDGAILTITSLDASVPYAASCTTSQGSWVINNVPEGANISIVATKDGWTKRRRVGSFQTQADRKNIIDFGGPYDGQDPAGEAYFISSRPEIDMTSPEPDAQDVDASKLTYELTLSKPLDDVNQARFSKALRLLPASDAAAPDNQQGPDGVRDVTLEKLRFGGIQGSYDPVLDQFWAYALKPGEALPGAPGSHLTASWDASGTVVTITADAPLPETHQGPAKYQLALASGGPDQRILDKDGQQLGLDAFASFDKYPVAGHLIHATVKSPDLALAETDTTPAWRWVATHLDAAGFSSLGR